MNYAVDMLSSESSEAGQLGSLVERGGKVRSQHVQSINAETLKPILMSQVYADTTLMTDEALQDLPIGPSFANHARLKAFSASLNEA